MLVANLQCTLITFSEVIKKVSIHFEVLFEPQVTESHFEIGRVHHPLAFIC
jgi:hypothetical protein